MYYTDDSILPKYMQPLIIRPRRTVPRGCRVTQAMSRPNRQRATTIQQVKGAVRICKEFGRKVATAEEARKICKVGVWYNSVEETLQNNGMPPNPTEYKPGFLVWETTGKKTLPPIAGHSHPIAACMIAPQPVRAAQTRLAAKGRI